MSRREVLLLALVMLLAGLIAGYLVARAFDDETDTPTTETTTTLPPTSITGTQPPPPTTNPPPEPLADATTGAVVGFVPGAPLADVVAELTARHGLPDADSGWTTGCPLDGDEALDERILRWGNFVVRGWRGDGPEVLDGWRFSRGPAGEFDETGPLPDDIVFPANVAWNMTIGEVAEALGAELFVLEDFGFAYTFADEFADYRGAGTSPNSFMAFVGWRAGDICE